METIKVCGVSLIPVNEMIKNYEKEINDPKNVYPTLTSYFKNQYEECCGNCTECQICKELTEKDLFIYEEQSKISNIIKFKIRCFMSNFILGCIFAFVTLPISIPLFSNSSLWIIAFVPLGFTLIMELLAEIIDFAPYKFDQYINDKWESKIKQTKEKCS